MTPMPSIVFYVTGHGYGHATRQAALMRAVKDARPDADVVVRTDAPEWLFPEDVTVAPKAVDIGLIQKDALHADLAETARRHEALLDRWEEETAAEASFLAGLGAGAVVSDAGALGVAAALRAGLPSFVVANFLWDWILDDLAPLEPRLAAPAKHYRSVYARATEVVRLPLSGGFEGRANVIDAPLLCRRSALTREEARAKLGVPEGGPAVLLTFGGYGVTPPPAGPGLEGFRFVGWGEAPRGLEGRWTRVPDGRAGATPDVVAACDLILTKPGYGIVSESIARRARVLHVPRTGFAEAPVLLEGLARHGCGAEIPLPDFLEGRWAPHLSSLLDKPWAGEPLSADGDRVIAGSLITVI